MEGSSIILGTDLSKTAEAAARWVHNFSRHQQVPVIVTHVVSISVSNWAKGAYDVLEKPDLMKKTKKRVVEWYENATGEAPEQVEILVGHPTVQLADAVDVHDASMLVLSVSGKGTWERLLLGSTAQNLASDPPCPLVLVEPDHVKLHEPPRIGVGVDFSDNSAHATSFAATLARAIGAEMHLVHVDTAPTMEALEDEDLPEEFTHDGMFEWAKSEMAELVEKMGDQLDGVDHEIHCIEEQPAKGLIDFARAEDFDLLIVGRAGHSPAVASVMGSVLLKVLQSVPTTTIIVPSDA